MQLRRVGFMEGWRCSLGELGLWKAGSAAEASWVCGRLTEQPK